MVTGVAAKAEHGFDNASALLDDGLDAVHASADLRGIIEVVLDDLGGAFDDGQDVVEVVGNAGGEGAQGIHLLAVQKLAVGNLQLPGALGNFLLDFRIAAQQLPMTVEGQAREEERYGQAGKGNQDETRFFVPGEYYNKLQPGWRGVDVAIAVHGADLEVVLPGGQVSEGDASLLLKRGPIAPVQAAGVEQSLPGGVFPLVLATERKGNRPACRDVLLPARQRLDIGLWWVRVSFWVVKA